MTTPRLILLMSLLAAGIGSIANEGELSPDLATAASNRTGPPPLEVEDVMVHGNSDRPRACVAFSEPIDTSGPTAVEAYLLLEPEADAGVSVRRNLICIDGLAHGRDYELTLLEGLPGRRAALGGGRTLRLSIPDRSPAVRFPGGGFVLPRLDAAGLPVETVNVETLAVRIHRVDERALTIEIREGIVFRPLRGRRMKLIADEWGELVWQGDLAIDDVANTAVRTAIPIPATIGVPAPGIYAASVLDRRKLDNGANSRDWATQWFIVSDLGLTGYRGVNGLAVTVRSLGGGRSVAGAVIELYARNNTRLGRALTDGNGLARFEAGLLRGSGGNRPRLVVARTAVDFAFIDLERGTLDLSDRGVAGRPTPGSLDAYVYTDRGIYRPGETVHAVALLRDAVAVAVPEVPLTLRVLRPDGIEFAREVVADAGEGGHPLSITIPANAYTGRWTVEARADPTVPAIGAATFLAADFVPPRIELDVRAVPERFAPGDGEARARIEAAWLYGGAAAGLKGELDLRFSAARDPFGLANGFEFGLVEEQIDGASPGEAVFTTGDDGRASVPLDLSALPATSSPVEVAVRARVFDIGGRPVGRNATVTVLPTPILIGVRPGFEGYVRAGETARFEVAAFDREGERVALEGLEWSLVRESYDWRWWEDDDRLRYRGFMWDEPIAGGSLETGAGELARIERTVDWGRYRLEVRDPKGGAETSIRFRAGWGGRFAGAGDTGGPPDQVTVRVSAERFAPGEAATVFIDPPFDAEVVVAVMDEGVRAMRFATVPQGGGEVTLEVGKDWAPGVYVVATAYGAPDARAPSIPQRAVGAAWMAVDRSGERLKVSIDAPAEIEPGQTVDVAVEVAGAAGAGEGGRAFVTLAAVDDGVLRLTRYTAPDPTSHFRGQRGLGVRIHDLYGRLIDASGARPGDVRSGGDRRGRRSGDGLDARSSRVVSLFSGVVPVTGGVATVPLAIPDFNGRLRLMAVAWSSDGVGEAEAVMVVAAPLVADLALPRFLAPGDEALGSLAAENRAGPAGSYRFELAADGPVSVAPPAVRWVDLERGERFDAGFRLRAADALGVARVTLRITRPDGAVRERVRDLAVRAPTHLVTERLVLDLPPGDTYRIEPTLVDGFLDGDVAVSLVAGTAPSIDPAPLLRELSLYPYGCAEQLTSIALPMLYVERLNAGIGAIDLSAAQLASRIRTAIRRLAAMQRRDGDFGLWSWHDSGSTWLTAYVMDFLTRARGLGHFVPEPTLDRGFAALTEALDYGRRSNHDAVAYALYVLARSGVGDAYALAYVADRLKRERLDPAGRALLAAALAALGDAVRAHEVFGTLEGDDGPGSDYAIYGSPLRDAAMVGALMAESGLASPAGTLAIAEALSAEYQPSATDLGTGRRFRTSTQEKAWLVVAAAAMRGDAPAPATLALGDREMTGDGALHHSLAWPPPAGGIVARNPGDAPLYLSLSWSGYPEASAPAEEHGFRVRRHVRDMDGGPIRTDSLHQHERIVVELVVESTGREGPAQALVVDLLPAGLELEDAWLEGSLDAGELAWLTESGDLAVPARIELRDDRFVAALDIAPDDATARVAYVARAVTPGSYVVPAPYVEDMYRPALFGTGEAGRLEVRTQEEPVR